MVLLVGSLFLVGCQRPEVPPAPQENIARVAREVPASAPGWFDERAAASGIAFTYRNGEEADHYTMLETLGGGVGLLDYDGDGRLDIFLVGGGVIDKESKEIRGLANRLYRNEGAGRFRDVTAEVGLDKPLFYGHGVAVGDYNNDGWPDLLVTGYGRMALYRNNKGKFEEVTQAACLLNERGLHWSSGAAWADFNGDGHLDLFVGHYVDWSFANHPRCQPLGPGSPVDTCPPHRFNPLPPKLYLNNGNGTFRDASAEAGLKPAKALGVLAVDVDDDGRPDIYVANDTIPSQLYLNKGAGKFEEGALRAGVALTDQGRAGGHMGVDAADYDGSGRLSLFVANYAQHAHSLYRNQGRGLFEHVSTRAGIASIGLNFVAFGTSFIDYDNDGVEDLVIANGHVVRRPLLPETLAQRPVLFRNLRSNTQKGGIVRFKDVSEQAGPYFHGKHRGRGLAVGDLDNDGRPDVVISHCNEPVALLKNVLDNGNRWLGVELRGTPLRDAVGAKLTLEVGGRRLVRVIKGGSSYLSSSDRRVVFGLGSDTKVERLTVRWPSGATQTWEGSDLPSNRYWLLVQGEKKPSAWPRR